jgi:hypothetical protein
VGKYRQRPIWMMVMKHMMRKVSFR